MKKGFSKADLILISGLVGIIAALLTIASDMILLGRPVSAYAFLKLGTQSMAKLEPWRITTGTFLGVFSLPFQIAGVIPLYYGLKPAGKRAAGITLVAAVYGLVMGVAFHISYAFIGSGWNTYYNTGTDNAAVSVMMTRFDCYWRIIIGAMIAGLLLVSMYCVVLILSAKSLYPKWMAVLNPLCINLLLYPLVVFIPAPLGGYIGPAYFNISSLVFFILALKTLGKDKSGISHI